ncbi:sulfonate ABC transporter substrate-binding protein [Paenibacillus tyrfis]|uniref:sulfonate ABC transporter substrate-binding protein n=1 Tax=Paenibacillus tyrfis TaxID=1501230 RepID=UPI00209F3008|nr:sulfonate ABC transporter substrate-binding protein [Paenibacillus tyrfis]MCP1308291.1 sulfonate ABC transporter substrate-binding protein [Paenibacillus tyrfis]
MRRKLGTRLFALALLAGLLVAAAAGCATAAKSGPGEKQQKTEEKVKQVRIGYQKYGTVNFLKAQGKLDQKLQAAGYTVTWTEFPGGPQLLEALNVGSIDFGHTGEAPPIFAQAAGAPLVYLAYEQARPASEAIVVSEASLIQSVKDLKDKKVALNKGSNVHYLLVKLLEQAGLSYSDVRTVFLPPADARVAFERGSVDAWVIWDPYFAAVQTSAKARVLADGKDVVSNHEFYLASRPFAKRNKEITAILLEELNKVGAWAKANPQEVAQLLSPQLGIDIPSLELAMGRRDYGLLPISGQVIAEQQRVADTFLQIGLIPKAIKVSEALLDS